MLLLPLLLNVVLALAVAVPVGLAASNDPLENKRRPCRLNGPAAAANWTCIIPYFNEAGAIEICLSSLAGQSEPPTIVLVDNGSTDESRSIAERYCIERGLKFLSLVETEPGKVAALAAGLAATRTQLVATCDADTYYPPDYLARAATLLERPSTVAAGAILISDPSAKVRSLLERCHWRMAALAAPWQCHSGGTGQVFRTQALRDVGGFNVRRWNFVLEDHEVMARLGQIGRIAYNGSFWCNPLVHRDRHDKVGWSLSERICYHMTTRRSMPAFFHGFLAPRLMQRGQWNIKLRPIADASLHRRRSFALTTLPSPQRSVPPSASLPRPAMSMR